MPDNIVHSLQSTVNRIIKTVNRKSKGFTLIELLIVIAIIAILVTVIVAAFGTAQAKARDTRRKTDLDAIKKGLELYKSDTRAGVYPACPGITPGGPCQISLVTSFSQTGGIPDLPTTPYFNPTQFPHDPRDSGNCGALPALGFNYAGNVGLAYCYWPQPPVVLPPGGISPADNQYPSYVLSACLENSNDQGENTFLNATANCVAATDDRTYGVRNP